MKINLYTKHKAQDFELEIEAEEGHFSYYLPAYSVWDNDNVEEGEKHYTYEVPRWVKKNINLDPDPAASKEDAEAINKYWDQIEIDVQEWRQ